MTTVAQIHLIGLAADRPTAGSSNNGYYYTATDTGGGTTYRSNGATWAQVAGAVTALSNPMTTQGDVIYGGASGTATRLAIGTAAQVLTVNAGATAPEWAAAGSGGIGDHGALVYRSTTQSIPNAAWTSVLWDAEKYDTDAYHDTGTNTDRLTIPSGQAGKYAGFANATIAFNATLQRGIRVMHYNSSDVLQDCLAIIFLNANSANQWIGNVSWQANLAVGDYVVVQVFHAASGGGALNLDADTGTGIATRAGIQRVA